MSDDTKKIEEKESAPAIAADSTELTEDSLKNVAGGTNDVPQETISLPYSKIEWKYTEQK